MKPTAALIAAGAFALTFAVGGVSGWLSRDMSASKPLHLELDAGWNTAEVPLDRNPRGWRLVMHAPRTKSDDGLEALLPGAGEHYSAVIANGDAQISLSCGITSTGKVRDWIVPVRPGVLGMPDDASAFISDHDGDGLPERIRVVFKGTQTAATIDLQDAIQREIDAWRSGFTPPD